MGAPDQPGYTRAMFVWWLTAALAAPTVGLSYVPFGRGDLAWLEDGRTSGRAVGELDGFVNPPLTAWGGAWVGRVGVFGGLGAARLTSTQWTGSQWRQRHWGVLRPSADLRWLLTQSGGPRPWVQVGVHGDIPSARDTSNAYDADEQTLADEAAQMERWRLGGIGGRVGFGVEADVTPEIAVGFTWGIEAHWATLRTSESTVTSSWVTAPAALLLAFRW